MVIRRFETQVSLPGLLNKGIEYIEFSENKGTFYRKGYFSTENKGIIFTVVNNIFRKRDIKAWYKPLSSYDLSETEEFYIKYPLIKEELTKIDGQINISTMNFLTASSDKQESFSNELNLLYFRRTSLIKFLGSGSFEGERL